MMHIDQICSSTPCNGYVFAVGYFLRFPANMKKIYEKLKYSCYKKIVYTKYDYDCFYSIILIN